MRWLRLSSVVLVAIVLSSCYHAVINTGLAPSGQTITNKWATGWLYGLVPPKVVETASQCPNGAARVETQLSFLNQLASAITFGIYSPMTIEVQCAASRSASVDDRVTRVPAGASEQARAAALGEAVRESLRSGEAAYVVFE
jgi:hypothetical protein